MLRLMMAPGWRVLTSNVALRGASVFCPGAAATPKTRAAKRQAVDFIGFLFETKHIWDSSHCNLRQCPPGRRSARIESFFPLSPRAGREPERGVAQSGKEPPLLHFAE